MPTANSNSLSERTPNENQLRCAVKSGGGRFLGVWNVEEIGGWVESVVMFTAPTTGTTLSVPVSSCTPEFVAERIRQSNVLFGL
jgi:hypothetical protein